MKSLPRYLGFLFALGVLLFAGVPRSSAENADSEQISKLLADAKIHAVEAEDDAASLDSFTRSRVSWQQHAIELESMKRHVNEIGKIVADMQELEPQGSPWQKQAIAQISPLLRDMGDHLGKTIEHLNNNQKRIHMPDHMEYSRTNYQLAKRTADLIRDFIEYDQAQATTAQLEEKLELAQN
jgi:hypothetical protein